MNKKLFSAFLSVALLFCSIFVFSLPVYAMGDTYKTI